MTTQSTAPLRFATCFRMTLHWWQPLLLCGLIAGSTLLVVLNDSILGQWGIREVLNTAILYLILGGFFYYSLGSTPELWRAYAIQTRMAYRVLAWKYAMALLLVVGAQLAALIWTDPTFDTWLTIAIGTVIYVLIAIAGIAEVPTDFSHDISKSLDEADSNTAALRRDSLKVSKKISNRMLSGIVAVVLLAVALALLTGSQLLNQTVAWISEHSPVFSILVVIILSDRSSDTELRTWLTFGYSRREYASRILHGEYWSAIIVGLCCVIGLNFLQISNVEIPATWNTAQMELLGLVPLVAPLIFTLFHLRPLYAVISVLVISPAVLLSYVSVEDQPYEFIVQMFVLPVCIIGLWWWLTPIIVRHAHVFQLRKLN
ncbi:CENP-N/CHL4 family protein [Corynebacterium sp. HS2168-gen11]|uniref:CENP-N/CHL4 family protein n=1 Tax=Corynebacterium sp. HS2168-gen11 TaxID=2974027 RepID=UPI00216B38AB|nr:CENP-N/CHL4 family protein [Corynebacterium sp. HS2168-gen11]MCS4536473.1 CENP-N/CHL4 family protein [Corynebacterium sp. HS2168-gen11]